VAAIDAHGAALKARGDAEARLAWAEAHLQAALAARLHDRLRSGDGRAARAEAVRSIAEHALDPYAAADRLLAALGE
jgi:hypothetical protein